MATLTPILGLSKPIVGADDDIWGNMWNQNADILDGLVKPVDLAPYLLKAGGTMTGPLTLSANAVNALHAVPFQQLNSGLATKIGDAPNDGGYYARRNLGWEPSPGSAINQDAPSDGFAYGRRNASWDKTLRLAGGTMTGDIVLKGDATAALNPVTLQQLTTTAGAYLPLAGGATTGAVGVGVPLIAGLPAAALITNDVYIHGTLGFNTAWISTGTPGWKYLTAGNAGIISFDPAAATPGIGFYIGPAGAAGAAASMPNAAYMSATSFVATGSITSGTAVIAGTHIYCGGTLLINPANSWEWYFARDGSGNHIHNHRANWYDMWNGADGKRSWASPSGDCMTLDGSGNFVARGNVQGAWVYSTGQVRADTSSVAYGQIISYGQRVSAEGSGEPSVFMHRPGAYAAGMLLNGSNQLLFANMGGGGNWQATLGYFDTSGNFWATAALTGNWIHSTGSMQIDGDATVNGRITANYIRATDSIMCDSGNFFIGNNQAYRLQRESWSGSWVFYDNNTWNFQVNSNGDAQTRMTHYAQDHFCRNALRTGNDWNFYLGPGGGGRLLQFAGNWYQQWNSSNGEYAWYANGGWMFGQRTSDWLCWNGTGPVGGYGAYQNFSDARGKTDITHTEVGLPEVMRMKPARFTRKWKPELITGRTFPDGRPQPDFIPRSEIGFIAQELQEALPEAVVEVADFVDGEARLMMTLDPIVAALVNAVKTLNGRLVKLEGRH